MANHSIWNILYLAGYVYLFLSIVSFTVGVYLYNYFFQCENFQFQSWYDWSDYYGYNFSQFVALLVGTILLPSGIIFMLVFSILSYKYIKSLSNISIISYINTLLVYAILIVAFIIAAVLSYYLLDARDVLSCGIWCYKAETTVQTKNNAGIIMIGTLYFIGSIYFIILFTYQSVLIIHHMYSDKFSTNNKLTYRYKDLYIAPSDLEEDSEGLPLLQSNGDFSSQSLPTYQGTAESSENPSTRRHVHNTQANQTETKKVNNKFKWLFISGIFLIVYPILFIGCLILPDWWNSFTRDYIQNYEGSSPSRTLGFYWSYQITSTVNIKLYPDILMFYLYIYVLVFTAILSIHFPALKFYLSKRISFYSIGVYLSVGELLMAISLVGLPIGFFFYWYYDHGFQGNVRTNLSNAEVAARSMGQVANLLMGILLLPISKNSVWTELFNVSWESMLEFHKYLGVSFFGVVVCHMLLWWKVYSEQGTFPHDIYHIPSYYYGDDFTVPLAYVTTILGLILMVGFGYVSVRRWNYDLFYMAHYFSMAIFLMMLWHATMSWYYITAGLSLWAIDRTIRWFRAVSYTANIQFLNVAGNDNIVNLGYVVSKPGIFGSTNGPLKHAMGQYMYINIPSIDPLAWHPFTISSAPSDPVTTHHIKAINKGTKDSNEWTDKLLALAGSLKSSVFHGETVGSTARLELSRLIVNIDGPYGRSIDTDRYTHILLIGGGIGITPLVSTYKHMFLSRLDSTRWSYAHIKQVKLVWVVKSQQEASTFEVMLVELQKLQEGTILSSIENGDETTTSSTLHTGPLFSYEIFITTLPSFHSPSNTSNNLSTNLFNESFTSPIKKKSFSLSNDSNDSIGMKFKRFGRPNLPGIISEYHAHREKAIVYACGPTAMIQECQSLASQCNIDFFQESFEF